MSKDTLYNFSTLTHNILTEAYISLSTSIRFLGNTKRAFLGGANFLVSTANSTVASLVENIDYTLENIDSYYTSMMGENVYTGLSMLTHASTDIWLTYKTIGSYTDIFSLKINKGMTLSNNAVDANYDIDIDSGFSMPSSMTKQLDSTWTEGTNQGMLDTGAIASSYTYHIYQIKKDSDGTVDVLASLNATSPALPTGWNFQSIIGCVFTSSSSAAIYPFYQVGNIFRFKTMIVDRNFAALGATTRILVTVSTPENLFGIFNVGWVWYDATGISHMCLSQSVAETDSSVSATNNNVILYTQWETHKIETEILVDSNRQIALRGDHSSIVSGVFTLGWMDHRI